MIRIILAAGLMASSACAKNAPTARDKYLSCVHHEAALIGTRATITAAQADQIVAQCRKLLRPAASQVSAQAGRMTNLPEGMETEAVRLSTAIMTIEHDAKMQISANVLPLPVP